MLRILSFNVRGLGGVLKKAEIRKLIAKEKVDLVCIQETKKVTIVKRLVESMWGHENVDWVYSGSTGASGGLLCMWNKVNFQKVDSWGEEGDLGVKGMWRGEEVDIVNVYAPCSDEKKE